MMRNDIKVITVLAAEYEDHDNCLKAAAEAYREAHPELEGYQLWPRYVGGVDGDREEIALTVPADDGEDYAED